jgi:hypothetical protein
VLAFELWGVKGLFLMATFGGAVPILAGVIIATAAGGMSTVSVWIISASPVMAPSNAVATAISDGIGNLDALRLAGPRAFLFWQGLMVITVLWLFNKHRARSFTPGKASAATSEA